MSLRDVFTALLSVTILGLAFVAIKIGLRDVPPLLLTGLRFFFAAVPAVFLVSRPAAPVHLVIAFGFMLGVVFFGMMFTAMNLGMPAGLSSLVVQTQVFFTIVLAYIILGERPTALQIVGGLVAACGILAIAQHWSETTAIGPFLLVLGAALAWGAANIITKRAGRVDMLSFVVWASLAAPLPLLFLSLLVEGPASVAYTLTHPTWQAVGSVAFLAYPATLLAFSLWNRLLSRYSAATVTPFALLVPVAGILGAHLVLGEQMDASEAYAGLLVFIGLVIGVVGGKQQPPRGAAPSLK